MGKKKAGVRNGSPTALAAVEDVSLVLFLSLSEEWLDRCILADLEPTNLVPTYCEGQSNLVACTSLLLSYMAFLKPQ